MALPADTTRATLCDLMERELGALPIAEWRHPLLRLLLNIHRTINEERRGKLPRRVEKTHG